MSRPTVILLDDDIQISRLLDEALSEDGCDVRLVRTIAEFQRAQADQHFDINIVDLGLPDGNGLSLIQELAQEALLHKSAECRGSPFPDGLIPRAL